MAKNKLKGVQNLEVIKKKCDKLYVRQKGYNNLYNSLVNKKDIVSKRKYFSKRKFLGANVKVELDLSNYGTKADLKNAIGLDA